MIVLIFYNQISRIKMIKILGMGIYVSSISVCGFLLRDLSECILLRDLPECILLRDLSECILLRDLSECILFYYTTKSNLVFNEI